MRIDMLFIGQPQTHTDERGTWRSAIYRTAVTTPIAVHDRGLAGDQVADTEHHGSPDQAVCCHPLDHYAYWNAAYALDTPATRLGPGSVGENWTLSAALEDNICIGDTFAVGSACVQVSAPRYPCTKQERKLRLPAFHQRTMETLRTGFYLRVLTPGIVQAGDTLTLTARPRPDLTIQRINVCIHRTRDAAFMRQLLDVPELAEGWKRIFRTLLTKQATRPETQDA